MNFIHIPVESPCASYQEKLVALSLKLQSNVTTSLYASCFPLVFNNSTPQVSTWTINAETSIPKRILSRNDWDKLRQRQIFLVLSSNFTRICLHLFFFNSEIKLKLHSKVNILDMSQFPEYMISILFLVPEKYSLSLDFACCWRRLTMSLGHLSSMKMPMIHKGLSYGTS